MMTGLPCVATAVGGVPDALGPAGILVPPDDPDALAEALGELVDSPERRRSLGEVARARAVERFSIDRMVGETVAVYSEALAA
jgi:glycosyltransferase involved in cell wall biosynthesis